MVMGTVSDRPKAEQQEQDREDETADYLTKVSDNMMLEDDSLLDIHRASRQYAKENWIEPGYVPSGKNQDRCNRCTGCKVGSCLTVHCTVREQLDVQGIKCISCDNKQICVLRIDAVCDDWPAQLRDTYRAAVLETNVSLKRRYMQTNLTQLEGSRGWFVYLAAATIQPAPVSSAPDSAAAEATVKHSAVSAAAPAATEAVDSTPPPLYSQSMHQYTTSTNTSTSTSTCTGATPKSPAFVTNNDMKGLVDTMGDGFHRLENLIAGVTNNQSALQQQQQNMLVDQRSLLNGQQSNAAAIAALSARMDSQESLSKSLGRDIAALHRRSPPPVRMSPPISSAPDPAAHSLDRLAQVLEKSLVTKPSTRLPQFQLPKLSNATNTKIDSASFWSWKSKCVALLEEHSVPDSLAVSLLQSEPSLPTRFRNQISSATSPAAIWQTMATMVTPVHSLLPLLLNDLTSISPAFDYNEQIKAHDQILLKISQLKDFFPTADVTQSQLAAILSIFASNDNLAQIPDTMTRFESDHRASGISYLSLLQAYCQKRRGDLYVIQSSLDLYRSNFTPVNMMGVGREAGGRGGEGCWGRGGTWTAVGGAGITTLQRRHSQQPWKMLFVF